MSMNLFFLAYTQQEIDEIDKNHKLIDESLQEEKFSFRTDVETAWDVLREILGGIGVEAGQFIDNALFNGCFLISSDEVKIQAEGLSKWSREKVLARLKNLDQTSNLYHLEVFQDEEEYLLEQFEKMAAFYKEAAEKGLGAISYTA